MLTKTEEEEEEKNCLCIVKYDEKGMASKRINRGVTDIHEN